jgi:Spy/CpxP family protein refolding chaperone
LVENLFPPDLIMHNAEAIGLTEEQHERLQAEMQKAQDRFEELHSKLQKQREATAALLRKEQVDEAAALAQFEKLFEVEREVRRGHLTLMLALKNKLTPAQQTKLQELKKHAPRQDRVESRPGKPPPLGLQEKMKKLKAGVKKLEDEGGDATEIGQLMHDFKPLMDEQKFKQAEELLDQALRLLKDQKRQTRHIPRASTQPNFLLSPSARMCMENEVMPARSRQRDSVGLGRVQPPT